MSPLRVIRQRFWMCLGLAMVIAGGTAGSMGYLAANDAKSRAALVMTSQAKAAQPTTKKTSAGATTKKSSSKTARTSRKGTAVALRKP